MHLPGRRQPPEPALTPAQARLIAALNGYPDHASTRMLTVAATRALAEAGADHLTVLEARNLPALVQAVMRSRLR